MDCSKNIHSIMEEIGPLLRLSGVYKHAGNNWSIYVDDEQEIFIEYLSDQQKLVFSTFLTLPKEADQLEIYTSLLQFNALWKNSLSSRFGLLSDKKRVEFSQSLVALDLDLQKAANFFLLFSETIKRWSLIFIHYKSSSGDQHSTEFTMANMLNHFIKV